MLTKFFSQLIRKLIFLLTKRITWMGIAILIQLFLIIEVITRFQENSIYIQTGLMTLSAIMVVWILNSRKTPHYQLAWIIPILIFPVIGGLLYLIMGGNQTTKYARKKMNAISENLSALAKDSLSGKQAITHLNEKDKRQANQALYIEKYTLMPPFQHNETQYFPSGEAFFDKLLIELAKAKEFIFMEYFIVSEGYLWDKIFAILRQKALDGVDIRFIYDDFGGAMHFPTQRRKEMLDCGIKCEIFGPFHPILSTHFNNRDHRKITVIDGVTAFTGGANLADEYINHIEVYGHWKDSGIMIVGEAANGFTALFLSMWDYLTNAHSDIKAFMRKSQEVNFENGFVQPFYDSPLDAELVSETVFRNLISHALESVYIFTPYLVISSEMTSTIANAAKRGVEVHIITPGVPDKWYVQAVGRASYEELIEAGVHIYEYQPGFIHSKVMLVDNEIAFVGTVNMDYRSMYLHFECGLLLYGGSSLAEIAEDIKQTIDCSKEIIKDDINKVALIRRLFRSILKVFAPLM